MHQGAEIDGGSGPAQTWAVRLPPIAALALIVACTDPQPTASASASSSTSSPKSRVTESDVKTVAKIMTCDDYPGPMGDPLPKLEGRARAKERKALIAEISTKRALAAEVDALRSDPSVHTTESTALWEKCCARSSELKPLTAEIQRRAFALDPYDGELVTATIDLQHCLRCSRDAPKHCEKVDVFLQEAK